MTGWSPEVGEVVGRFRRASNATFLARTVAGELVIYKPTAGERPLWDFPPDTLAAREALTYEVSEGLGFGVVPETALGEGPLGRGSIQRFVEVDDEFDPVALLAGPDPVLWPIAILDVVCNNADRKAGHLMRAGGRIFGVDHGLTFHPEEKLRTVLWNFAGAVVPAEHVDALRRLGRALERSLGARIAELVGNEAAAATAHRVEALLADPVHPLPPDDRPALPWPPY